MAYSEFYCDPVNGSNLAGGSDSGSPSMTDTTNTGSWTSTTQVYVSSSKTGSVTVGQFMSLYLSGATIPITVARITAVTGGGGSAWTITVSNTAYSGTQPSALTTGTAYNAQVGGAWLGPNGTVSFPFGFITNVLTDAAGDYARVSFKNSATYSITAAMAHALAGPVCFQGMTATPGDGGQSTISGAVTGASFALLTCSSTEIYLRDLIFQNNGATGNTIALSCTGSGYVLERVCVNNVVGNGIGASGTGMLLQCELYVCNTSNTAGLGAVRIGSSVVMDRCTIHSNTGSNNCGVTVANSVSMIHCIFAGNQLGISCPAATTGTFVLAKGCTFYDQVGDGIKITSSTNKYFVVVENSEFAGNGGYGIDNLNGSNGAVVRSINNAFYGNTSGQTNGSIDATGTITLSGDPTNNGANGDFSLNNTAGAGAACRNAGCGAYTQIAGDGYTATTTGYPDVGAVQHLDAGGSVSVHSPIQPNTWTYED